MARGSGEASEEHRGANVREGIWSVELAERIGLAEQSEAARLKRVPAARSGFPLLGPLPARTLSEVDWHEVAGAFLEDVEPDPSDDDDQADKDEEAEAKPTRGRAPIWGFEREKRDTNREPEGARSSTLATSVSTPGALGGPHPRGHREGATHGTTEATGARLTATTGRRTRRSLSEGFRLLSVYLGTNDTKFWVITEADRSSTCVLLPEEY